MRKEIRIGIIGSGYMAKQHLNAYRKVKGARIVAVFSRNNKSAKSICSQFRISSYYSNLDDLLAHDIDAVDIVTPTFTHEEMIKACFASGRHVLCEKPISLTLDEADRILEAQRKSGRFLMIAFQMRFSPEFIYAKQLVNEKKLGNIKVAWFRRGKNLPPQLWYRDKAESGGVTAEFAVHAIDWLRWMVGSEVKSVVAEGTGDIYNLGKEDNIWALYRFVNGAIGVIGSSYSFNFIEKDIGIIGDKLSLRFRRGRVILDDYRKKRHILSIAFRDYLSSLFVPFGMVKYSSLINELQHFVDFVRENREPAITGEEARKTLELVLATVKAMKTNQRVVLNNKE